MVQNQNNITLCLRQFNQDPDFKVVSRGWKPTEILLTQSDMHLFQVVWLKKDVKVIIVIFDTSSNKSLNVPNVKTKSSKRKVLLCSNMVWHSYYSSSTNFELRHKCYPLLTD